MMSEIYFRKPLRFQGTIPVFSAPSEYTDNYERISIDHLKSMWKNGSNPFIPEDLWGQLDNSTIALIKKYSKPGEKILDTGVGLGRLLSQTADLQRYGMDISFSYLEIAMTKGIEVCYARIEDMPYREEMFDIVVSTDVLEHVLDLNLCVAKILSVLKSNGVLIVRVPYRENLSQYLQPEYPYKYVHMRNFDEHSLRLLFERLFECEVIETVFGGDYLTPTYLKCPLSLKTYDRLERFLNLLKFVHERLYWAFVRKLYYTVEINVVVKKY
jgi:SAM-dependent methyltransferase